MSKIISVLLVVVIVATGFWVVALPWVHSAATFADWQTYIAPLAALCVLAAVLAIAYLVLPQKRWKLTAAAVPCLAYLAVFGFHYLHVVAIALMFAAALLAMRAIERESRERLKIHPGLILRRGIAFIVLPMLIALSFAYYTSPALQQRVHAAHELPPTFKQAVSSTVDKILESQGVPEHGRKAAATVALERTYNAFAGYLDRYKAYVPPLLAFGMFLILWGISFILNYLSIGLGMVVFWALRKSGFVAIQETMVPAETISLQNVNIKMENDSVKS